MTVIGAKLWSLVGSSENPDTANTKVTKDDKRGHGVGPPETTFHRQLRGLLCRLS
jgi:hypothetical protein